ncbi:MAG TPA: flagellar biosynthesis protein FlhB [Peptococcaceae bacterium]|jgi:flagellar biosynthetic protein FlhB|nr:flagellar biosynthesis protein FlhB [Clostridia bacterium]HOB81327.1 flagellar biosynthesis protein FlhB [Peptococcaceae bacterium]HPZ70603.1 flagellar biosynthesis protein FlhB [Peptococcaceae bacterium]HQD53413.1 flagellar biosynthesis protein FlhB [Peptococcaceae bacterium]
MLDLKEFKINLQLFAGEKTEKATPRRRQEARKKGQVVKSNEIITVVVLALTLVTLRYWIPFCLRLYRDFFQKVLSYGVMEFTVANVFPLLLEMLLLLLAIAGPILLVAMVAGFLANILQIGFLVTTESLKIDFNRLNPVNGMKRIFSKRALAELVKTLFKTFLVGFVAFSFLYRELPRLMVLMDYNVPASLGIVGDVTYAIGWRVLAVLLVIAVADYGFQYYDYEQSLKMSKQEIKEELKQTEGDPHVKAEIKARQRQMATRRMMQEVPQATVVITNPTHYAVALKYEQDMPAPVVVAKGQDFMAQRIKTLAMDHDVTIVENKSLARALYQQVEIGEPIPEELYKAIAEILAYVYRLKGHF